MSLGLQPGWPKGFFRKGKALRGLKVQGLGRGHGVPVGLGGGLQGSSRAGRGARVSSRSSAPLCWPQRYAEAVSTFEELLRLDGANADAAAQLEACRALLRVSPGSGIPGIPSCCTAGPEPCLTPQQNSSRGWHSPGGIPLSPSLLEAGEPPLPLSGKGPRHRFCFGAVGRADSHRVRGDLGGGLGTGEGLGGLLGPCRSAEPAEPISASRQGSG